jgi:hypothetical protein
LLDQFFERLCQNLSDITGVNSQKVGYRDISSLSVGAPWPQELVQAMQVSQVLISLISPHYLLSVNCGREFHVFIRRYQLLKAQPNQGMSASPIIPIFWTNSDDVWIHATRKAKDFLESHHLTGPGLPDDYPVLGVSRQSELAKPQAYSQICLAIADRVKQLAERQPGLPVLEGIVDFRQLPSAFDPNQTKDRSVEPLVTPVFDLGHIAPPPGVVGGSAPPGLHLAP